MTLTGERGGKGEKGGAGRRERGVGGKGEATTHSFLKKVSNHHRKKSCFKSRVSSRNFFATEGEKKNKSVL